MSPARYLARSLVYHRHATLGVFAGAVLGATVLLGALFAGASVRASLARAAEQRTGQATQVVTAGDRFFRAELAPELAAAAGGRSAPVLLTQGSAVHAGSQARTGQVQILGVTPEFWTFAPRPAPPPAAGADAVAVNLTLATRLGLKVGDTLVVRFPKPGVIAGNAPIAGAETSLESLRGRVAAVIGDDAYGRFGLEATQLPPATVYLPLPRLQEALEQAGRANLVAVGVVHFVAVAMTFVHQFRAVEFGRERARTQRRFVDSQTHGATHVARVDDVNLLRHSGDHGNRRGRVELG